MIVCALIIKRYCLIETAALSDFFVYWCRVWTRLLTYCFKGQQSTSALSHSCVMTVTDRHVPGRINGRIDGWMNIDSSRLYNCCPAALRTLTYRIFKDRLPISIVGTTYRTQHTRTDGEDTHTETERRQQAPSQTTPIGASKNFRGQ